VLNRLGAAYDRMFNKRDEEVDYQWNLGRKGLKNYFEPHLLSTGELVQRLGGSSSKEPIRSDLLDADLRRHLHPHVEGVFEFWIDQELPGSKDM
jgi:hypothetical protein